MEKKKALSREQWLLIKRMAGEDTRWPGRPVHCFGSIDHLPAEYSSYWVFYMLPAQIEPEGWKVDIRKGHLYIVGPKFSEKSKVPSEEGVLLIGGPMDMERVNVRRPLPYMYSIYERSGLTRAPFSFEDVEPRPEDTAVKILQYRLQKFGVALGQHRTTWEYFLHGEGVDSLYRQVDYHLSRLFGEGVKERKS